MTSIYSYSLTSDFGGNLKQYQFHTEIVESTDIAPDLIGIHMTGDVVDVEFVSSLSVGEQTILDTLVSNHVPDNSKPKKNFFNITPDIKSIKNKTYTLVGVYDYKGVDIFGEIDYIEVIAKISNSAHTYDIKIVRTDTNQIIASTTNLNNTNFTTIDLGTLSNLPTTQTMLEFHVKSSNNGGNVNIQTIIIYHGN